jgi:arginase
MKTKTILTPYFLDQPLPGLEELVQPTWLINHQDLPEVETQSRMSVLHASLAVKVEGALREGLVPVSLAGDCCTAIGFWAGLQRAGINPLLIWFDAHGDFNTWETTPSGFLGGMPLAMLVGLGEQALLDQLDALPLQQNQVILTDGRDLDPGEEELLQSSAVRHLQNPFDLLDIPLENRLIWVHFDTDIIDPEQSPAQNYPAAGGPGAAEMGHVFQHLSAAGLIQAVSLSSWNPDLEGAKQSKDISLRLLDILIRTGG